MMTMLEQFKQARRTATPLVAIGTSDPAVTAVTLLEAAVEGTPTFLWDAGNGLRPVSAEAKAFVQAKGWKLPAKVKPIDFLDALAGFEPRALVIATGLGEFLNADNDARPFLNQLVWNLRDVFKRTGATLVMLDPDPIFGPLLRRDVWILEDPLPSETALADLAGRVYQRTIKRDPTDAERETAVSATRGLPAFLSEQALYMSMRPDGIDVDDLWERKRVMIEQTPGLTVRRGDATFAEIAGYDQAKKWARAICGSPELKPRVVVFLDELEKGMAGATAGSGDNTGVSQGFLQGFLTEMQNRRYHGGLFLGPPGSGKSATAKAIGAEAGALTIEWDINAMKTAALGSSEAAMREAFRVIYAMSGGRAFFVATCNSIFSLPPELRRRFKRGTFYFDLPTAMERAAIWNLYRERFSLDGADPLPDDEGWTGAEIETCCENAAYLRMPLREAAEFVVPVARSAAESIKMLRALSHNRFLSASYPGPYKDDSELTVEINLSGLRNIEPIGNA